MGRDVTEQPTAKLKVNSTHRNGPPTPRHNHNNATTRRSRRQRVEDQDSDQRIPDYNQ